MTNSSKRAVKPGKLEITGERDSASSEIEKVVKNVEVRAEAFKKAVRQTVEEAWELGDALLSAKAVFAHGHWLPWLEKMGLHQRLAQRCIDLRRRHPEKRHMSHFKSINAAMRMLPAGRAIDAEFAVEDVESVNDRSEPKDPVTSAAGSNSASDSSTEGSPVEVATDFTAQTPAAVTEVPHGSIEAHSSRDTDVLPDQDVDRDVRSLLQELNEFVTRLSTVVRKDRATVSQRFGPHFTSFSRCLRVVAWIMTTCLESAGDRKVRGEDVPEALVSELQRLLKAVSKRGLPHSDNSNNRS